MRPLGNTPPANYSQHGIKPVLSGIDGIYAGYYGQPRRSVLERIRNGAETITLCGMSFSVKATPRGFYQVTLDNELMNLALDSCIPSPNSPSVLVQMKSAFIWSEGLIKAHQRVVDLMKWIYGDGLEGEKISRVDLFADLQWSGGFKETDIRRFVTRAREKITYHDGKRITGYKIGKGQLLARIYDKTHEARKSAKAGCMISGGCRRLHGQRYCAWRFNFAVTSKKVCCRNLR